MESLYDRTGFPFEIALMGAAVQVAPVDMERKSVLDVVLCHIFITPAVLIGSLEPVHKIALALELFAGERRELFGKIDIVISVLGVVREGEFSRTYRFDALDHRFRD